MLHHLLQHLAHVIELCFAVSVDVIDAVVNHPILPSVRVYINGLYRVKRDKPRISRTCGTNYL